MERTGCIAIGLALALAGCGGDDRLTRDRYVARAQALCTSANKQLEKAGRAMTRDMTEADFVKRSVAPIVGKTLDRIEKLEPPKADEARVEAMIAAGRRGLDRIQADPDSIRAPEGGTGDPFRDFDRRARAYGIRC